MEGQNSPVEFQVIEIDEESSTLVSQPNPQRPLTSTSIRDPATREGALKGYTKALRFEMAAHILLTILLIGALVSDWNNECPGHQLKIWVIVLIPIEFSLIFPNLLLQLNMTSVFRQVEAQRMEPVGIFYSASRVLNLFWVIWSFVGIFWTFSSYECWDMIPRIYTICLALSIFSCILIGLPLLLCLLSIPIVVSMYYLCPRNLGVEKIRKATPKMLKKFTKLAIYSSESQISEENAICAICLSEYVDGEEIRHLNCQHHFHSQCITDWLLKNVTCPYCKCDIDKLPEEVPLAST